MKYKGTSIAIAPERNSKFYQSEDLCCTETTLFCWICTHYPSWNWISANHRIITLHKIYVPVYLWISMNNFSWFWCFHLWAFTLGDVVYSFCFRGVFLLFNHCDLKVQIIISAPDIWHIIPFTLIALFWISCHFYGEGHCKHIMSWHCKQVNYCFCFLTLTVLWATTIFPLALTSRFLTRSVVFTLR
jgi:hypothetical protein